MIEVWAPRVDRVRLRRPGFDDIELQRDGTVFRSDVSLDHGQEYGFVLDDASDPVPDPRSRRQPRGVHDLSAVDDPATFEWTDAAWAGRDLPGAVVYELHIGTFTPDGTLDAAVDRLSHLVELGVTHVELLPVNAFNGEWGWGYDGVLWYAVHEPYGGPEAYRRFVDAAHAAGLAVVQDVVYNHFGPSGNYLPQFGPYLRDGARNSWGDSIDLDKPEVRSYIVENALMWLRDFHVDALRLDAVHALHDDQPVHILQELATAVDALSTELGRPLTLIAESDLNDATLVQRRTAGGYGLTAQWSDDWHHAVHVALTGETVGYYEDFADPQALPKVWSRGFFHDGTFSSFRGAVHGAPIPDDVPAWRLVTFAQDHDQIGNRAAGDRLTATLDARRLAVAAVLTMTAPGTPMLFQGEEWGATTPWAFFTSHPEPDLAEAVRTGRTQEFGRMGWDESLVPDPQDPQTFERSKLQWAELEQPEHARLLRLYRDLAALRRDRPELTDPDFASLGAEVLGAEGATEPGDPSTRAYLLRRGAVSIVVNLSATPLRHALGDDTVLLATDPAIALADGALVVPPDSAAVLGPAVA